MYRDYRRPPVVAQDALEVLNETLEGRGDTGIPKTEAKELLAADGDVPDDRIDYALDRLQQTGHIYYVEEKVKVTSTD